MEIEELAEMAIHEVNIKLRALIEEEVHSVVGDHLLCTGCELDWIDQIDVCEAVAERIQLVVVDS